MSITTISISRETKEQLLRFKGELQKGTSVSVNFDLVINNLLEKVKK